MEKVIYKETNKTSVQSQEFFELLFVESGHMKLETKEKESRLLSANDLFIVYPGERHSLSVKSSDQLEMIRCKFSLEQIQLTYIAKFNLTSFMSSLDIKSLLNNKSQINPHIKLEKDNAQKIKQILLSMKEELDGNTSDSLPIIWLRFVELLMLLSRNFINNDNAKEITPFQTSYMNNEKILLIKEINNYLLKHYNEKVSTVVVANVFNISVRHLNRIYKQHTGLTVTDMIHQIRIDRAKDYLIDSDDKVINVALKVGYDDPAFFSRLFRRKVGCSPGYYKKYNAGF